MDHPGLPQLVIILVYLGLLLALGLFSSRLFKGTKEDYQVASHSIGPFLLLMSMFGTTMTAFALVGSSGEAFREGVGVYGMLASSSELVVMQAAGLSRVNIIGSVMKTSVLMMLLVIILPYQIMIRGTRYRVVLNFAVMIIELYQTT